MLTATQRAYIAGIVDGEGSIILTRSNARSSEAYVYPVVKIANTDKRLIDWLKEAVGKGAIGYKSRMHEGCKDVYHWGVASNEAHALLIEIRPYLVIKALQADVILALWDENETALGIVGRKNWGHGHSVPHWLRQWREACYLFLRDLNRRGPGGPHRGKEVLNLLKDHDAELARWRLGHAAQGGIIPRSH